MDGKDMKYTLKAPIKWRDTKENKDVLITELDIPEYIKVSQARKFKGVNQLDLAHSMTEVLANLDQFKASKLETPDAIDYMNALIDNGLVDDGSIAPFDFDVSQVKPYRALTSKIKVDVNESVEFTCQVLELSGVDKNKLNNADLRALKPLIPQIISVFTIAKPTI